MLYAKKFFYYILSPPLIISQTCFGCYNHRLAIYFTAVEQIWCQSEFFSPATSHKTGLIRSIDIPKFCKKSASPIRDISQCSQQIFSTILTYNDWLYIQNCVELKARIAFKEQLHSQNCAKRDCTEVQYTLHIVQSLYFQKMVLFFREMKTTVNFSIYMYTN